MLHTIYESVPHIIMSLFSRQVSDGICITCIFFFNKYDVDVTMDCASLCRPMIKVLIMYFMKELALIVILHPCIYSTCTILYQSWDFEHQSICPIAVN